MNFARLVTLPLLLLAAAAQALSVSGSIAGEAPAQARVSAWLVDSAGRPLTETTSTAVNNGHFTLQLPDKPPLGRAVWTLNADNLSWPGVTGNITAPTGVNTGETRLFMYVDANNNGRRDEGEALQEGTAKLGKAVLAFIFVDRKATVRAARGFDVNLQTGWNALSVELGKSLKADVLTSVTGMQLLIGR